MGEKLTYDLQMRFEKIEAENIDVLISKLAKLKKDISTSGERVKSLFAIAVIER